MQNQKKGRNSQGNNDAEFSQQGNRKGGSNGLGYNEMNGGGSDQYDEDRFDSQRGWNRENDNNGYNSFDRNTEPGKNNKHRNGGGGYGSTSNKYESRNNGLKNTSDK